MANKERHLTELTQHYEAKEQATPTLWKSKKYDKVAGHSTFEDFDTWREQKEQRIQTEREKQAKSKAMEGTESWQHTQHIPVINRKSARLMAERERLPPSEVHNALYEDACSRRQRQSEAEESRRVEEETFECGNKAKVHIETVVGRLHDASTIENIALRESRRTISPEKQNYFSTPSRPFSPDPMAYRGYDRVQMVHV